MIKRWPANLMHEHTPAAISNRLSHRENVRSVRDLVYGAIDGTVTTFSIVAGVSGAELSDGIILILGISNVLSDGFSMASGNYLATKAEMDQKMLLREYEKEQIALNPEGETEEIRQIFQAKGFEGRLLEEAVEKIIRNREEWLKLMLSEEYGLSYAGRPPGKAGIVTFIAFISFGMIPLLPFALGIPDNFFWSTLLTGFAFFLLGTLKSIWSLEAAWLSGLKTFIIGSFAAGLAYFVGVALKDLVS